MESDGMTETMQTDPTTGGQKGSKPEQPSLIPVEFLETLSRVYSKGLGKYERHNWRRGYRWSLSYDALQRHLMAFWKGEDLDEDGEPHLAHAAWHCATLIVFMKEQKEKDDRWKAAPKGPVREPLASAKWGTYLCLECNITFTAGPNSCTTAWEHWDHKWELVSGYRESAQEAGAKGSEERDEAEAPGHHLEGEEDPRRSVQQAWDSRRGGSHKEGWYQCQRCLAAINTFQAAEDHCRNCRSGWKYVFPD